MISLTSPVRTWAHGWPAGVKLAGLCLATMLLFAIQDMAIQVAALLLVALLYCLPGRVFLRSGLTHLRVLVPFVVILLVWHSVTDDLVLGITVILRMVTAVALANLVTMTTRLTELMDVVRRLLSPLRRAGISTAPLEIAMPLLIRFAPVLIERAELMFQSWRARSVRRQNWRIVLPMMLLALDDADRVGEA
ncbi:energy-coupling factor transporter transmembrane component T family protein [Paracoccus methylarcula]|uniref:Energy-coupling factor transporter transmembrane protein EcfT n=1 Tax=Paracoccus methylarcula TaxID=72022 RepID=A0A422QSM3_9RHOB|nr:energy-coupling factor transporter transmembrane protein EcfT [Paracoccus methylarcula]RNF33038.1 energy-coupling factor transporter transmembrane protein EcfT [Paracoccus methylarcula]